MQLSKLTVFVLFVATRTCRSEIVIGTSEMDKSMDRLGEDVVNIITSCYKDRINGIVLAGNLPSSIYKTLSVQHLIPVVRIDNDLEFIYRELFVPVQFRHKLKVFIIEASTWRQLDTLIVWHLISSAWWDHMASFFILDLSPGCVNFEDYLLTAWGRYILNTKLICRDHQNGRIIFNFNPFATHAPAPWRRVPGTVVPGINDHPITFFSREYRDNETICANLDFDKVRDVGNYAFHITKRDAYDLKIERGSGKKGYGYYALWHKVKHTYDSVFRTMNARLKYNVQTDWVQSIVSDIDEQVHSMGFTWGSTNRYMTELIMISYPHDQVERVIITHFRGYKSQLNKILTVVDVDTRYGIGMVYLATLIFLKFFIHQAVVPALLNLVRITCNMGVTNIPISTTSRLYLSSLLFFIVTMQGIFQGNLASLLTQNIPLKNAETLQDLVDMGFKKIYGRSHIYPMLENSDLASKYIAVKYPMDCVNSIKDDRLAACIEYNHGSVLDEVLIQNLHMSKKSLETEYLGFKIRWNWPLEQRFNEIISRMVEASILEPFDLRCSPFHLSDYQQDNEVNTEEVIKVMEFHELRFAFIILSIGLTCATIVFIIELAIGFKCKIVAEKR